MVHQHSVVPSITFVFIYFYLCSKQGFPVESCESLCPFCRTLSFKTEAGNGNAAPCGLQAAVTAVCL